MVITSETKLTDIIKEYPDLLDQLIRQDARFALLKTPFGRLAIKNATMQDAADKYHVPMDQLIAMLNDQLRQLKNQ